MNLQRIVGYERLMVRVLRTVMYVETGVFGIQLLPLAEDAWLDKVFPIRSCGGLVSLQ